LENEEDRIRMKVVRPRALLHVTAMCLLLAAATLSAEAQGRAAPPLEIESTRKSWEFNALRRTESTREPWEFDPHKPWEFDPLRRTESIGKLWKPKVRRSQTASTLEAPKQPLTKELDPRLKLVQKIDSRFTHFSVVKGTVKRFALDFEAGARNPESYLPEVSPELVSKWFKVPQENRIFIIGAGKDSAEVSQAAESLRAQGNEVFFYDFCRPLCSSKAVGAMFGTSGITML
jgi:hypothetical protein